MKKGFFVIAGLCLMLSYGTPSCTSKSNNASTQSDPFLTVNQNDPLADLKSGNDRFCSGQLIHTHQSTERIKELASGQHPKAVVITCSDSRVPPEIVFDQGLGDLFTIRTAGNVMSDYEEGSVEYAVEHLHTKLVIVMGHESCGAVTAMLEHAEKHADSDDDDDDCDEEPDHISSIIKALASEEEAHDALNSTEDKCSAMVRANVVHGVKQLRKSKPILSNLTKKEEIQIIGAVYHLDTGKVEFLDI